MVFGLMALMAAGFLILLYGGDCLVRGALSAAYKANVSPLLVGILIVGFGTSLPEFVIAVQSALSGREGLAHGNIIGSNIANIWLVIALPAIIFPIATTAPRMKLTALFMLVATLAWIGVTMFVGLNPIVGMGFIAVLLIYAIVAWSIARRDQTEDTPDEIRLRDIPGWRTVMLILIGLIALPLGSAILVEGGATLADPDMKAQLNMPFNLDEETIGLTILALGSSLPELGAGLAAAWRRQSDIAMGNILGSNIFNILGAGGIVAVLGQQQLSPEFQGYSHWAMLAAAVMITLVVGLGRRVGAVTGLIFVLFYALYLFGLVQNWNFEELLYLVLERPAAP
jgi:cation:H+ antiporter